MARKKKLTAPAGALAARHIYLLKEPDENSPALCAVNAGTYLGAAEENGAWTLVQFGLVQGWVPTDALER